MQNIPVLTPTRSTHQMFNQSQISTWTESDYERMLAKVEANFLVQPGDPEFESTNSLCELVYKYEAIHHPIPVRAALAAQTVRSDRIVFAVSEIKINGPDV